MSAKKNIPVFSVFCGAGAMDYGFKQSGFYPILALDNNIAAIDSYNHNFPNEIAQNVDLADVSAKKVISMVKKTKKIPKGIIGGPPCQGFSFGNTKADINDPRNLLALKYSEIIIEANKEFGIDFFVFENVLGLKSSKHQHRLQEIKLLLEKAGFSVHQQVLDASNFGVPQVRKRIFLIGINKEKFPNFKFNFPVGKNKKVTVRDALEGLPTPQFCRAKITHIQKIEHPNHWTMNPTSKKFETKDFNSGRSFRKLDWDKPSWTVAYGNREIHIHPDGNRRLSVYEAMLLQKFPKKYVLKGTFSEQIHQVSNAVPPPVARAVAASVANQLYTNPKQPTGKAYGTKSK